MDLYLLKMFLIILRMNLHNSNYNHHRLQQDQLHPIDHHSNLNEPSAYQFYNDNIYKID